MHIERLSERRRASPEIGVLRGVVVHDIFRIAHLGKTIHHEAMESEILHAALEFTCRSFGVLHWQRGESTQARRMTGNMFSEDIIGPPRNINRLFGVRDTLNAG